VGFFSLVLAAPAHATFPGKNGRIAFVDTSGSGTDVFTMNEDGTAVRQLTFFGANGGFVCCPSWSPDGKTLVFAVEPGPPFNSELLTVNADGTGEQLLLSEDAFFEFFPSFSPDGSQIVFSRCSFPEFHCAIFRVARNGGNLTAITQFDHNPDVNDFAPQYSPDGTSIAFESFTRGGIIAAIYLMGADGTNIHQLTPAMNEALNPSWSPDGKRIAFWVNCCDPPPPQIWSIHADGSIQTQLTDPRNAFDFSPSWSPQQDAIAFERDSSGFTSSAIYVISANGSGQNLALQSSGPKSQFVTPKGRFVARKRIGKGLQMSILDSGFSPQWGPAAQ
jgi:Tol biopolymer transport system component